nr:Chain 5, RRP17 isoform 1 [Saccharomyces cerevisiae BY4741]
YLTKNERR